MDALSKHPLVNPLGMGGCDGCRDVRDKIRRAHALRRLTVSVSLAAPVLLKFFFEQDGDGRAFAEFAHP